MKKHTTCLQEAIAIATLPASQAPRSFSILFLYFKKFASEAQSALEFVHRNTSSTRIPVKVHMYGAGAYSPIWSMGPIQIEEHQGFGNGSGTRGTLCCEQLDP